MSDNKVQYESLLPHEVIAAREAKPLAYLPIGTIEWHGRHNPLGLDTLKAHELCIRAAQAGGGLAMPPLWWGEHREIQLMESNPDFREPIAHAMQLPPENFQRGYMGKSIEQQAHFYNDLLFHIFKQIESLGFRALIILCGHYPLQIYADYTAKVFEPESTLRVFGATEAYFVRDKREEFGVKIGDHAGLWETSLLMALMPGLTDLSQLNSGPEQNLIGVMGEDPRRASAELGQHFVARIVEGMVAKGDELLASM